jgi:hypothetical protein
MPTPTIVPFNLEAGGGATAPWGPVAGRGGLEAAGDAGTGRAGG